MRKNIIVGNWKMNKTNEETKDFMNKFKKLRDGADIGENVYFGFGAVSTSLRTLADNACCKELIVAAQNMHFEKGGAFTGELTSEMVKDAGANAVIIGHSERREMFNETNETVNKKTKVALAEGLMPIVCVGESLEQYEAGQTQEVVEKQIKESLAGIKEWDKVVIAYEPIWAIGTGKTATAEDAQSVCKFIRSITSDDVVIQYGGSVKPENVSELMAQPDIDGALVGGASLDPESFIKLITFK